MAARHTTKALSELKKLRQRAQHAAEEAAAAPGRPPPGKQQKAGARPRPGSQPSAPMGQDAPISLSDADKKLFRVAVRAVQPLRDTGLAVLKPVALDPDEVLYQRRLRAAGEPPRTSLPVSDVFTPAAVTNDARNYVKPGHGPDLIKGLRQGKWPVGASLDLHGSTLDEARERLDRFLSSCIEFDVRCVRIVHGKGHGSRGKPVLKTSLRRWLTQIDAVLAYTECAEADGGAGAVLCLLKTARTRT